MEVFLIKAAQLILSLSILVILHELGHYLPAVLFKTRVEKFYLFFNPGFSILRYRKVNGVRKYAWFTKKTPESWADGSNNTEWGIGWLPLGGYVKIAGMIDESMDKNQMENEPQPHEFRTKKVWQRFIIMVGGVVVNLILGFIIYIGVLLYWGSDQIDPQKLTHGMSVHPYMAKYGIESGDKILEIEGKPISDYAEITKKIMLRGERNILVQKQNGVTKNIVLPEEIDMELFQNGAMPIVGARATTAVIKEVVENSPAETAGLKPGESIDSINGQSIHYFDELQSILYNNKDKDVLLSIQGKDQAVRNIKCKVKSDGTLGFKPDISEKNLLDSNAYFTKNFGFVEGVTSGISYGMNTLSDYVAQFKFIFTKKGATSMGGFASMGNMFAPSWDWHSFWLSTALISIILAFMNILPIPALDGGHLIFLLYEGITGKPAPEKVLVVAQYIGFFFLIGLMLYANGSDIYRLIFP